MRPRPCDFVVSDYYNVLWEAVSRSVDFRKPYPSISVISDPVVTVLINVNVVESDEWLLIIIIEQRRTGQCGRINLRQQAGIIRPTICDDMICTLIEYTAVCVPSWWIRSDVAKGVRLGVEKILPTVASVNTAWWAPFGKEQFPCLWVKARGLVHLER